MFACQRLSIVPTSFQYPLNAYEYRRPPSVSIFGMMSLPKSWLDVSLFASAVRYFSK